MKQLLPQPRRHNPILHFSNGAGAFIPTTNTWFLAIPKNGTNTINNYPSSEYTLYRNRPEGCTVAVILRDPIERWVSGITEYVWLKGVHTRRLFLAHDQSIDEYSYLLHHPFMPTHDQLRDTVAFDMHTVPQCEFVAMDWDHVDIEIDQFYTMSDLDGLFGLRVYTKEDSKVKMMIHDHVESLLCGPLLDAVREYYTGDYALLRSAGIRYA